MAVVPEGEWSLHPDGWKPIDDLINSAAINFDMSNMLGYFLHRKAVDGCPNNDFKNVNRKAYPPSLVYSASTVDSKITSSAIIHS